MKDYRDFCNGISAVVEQKIISWHGYKIISHNQAIELLRHGYMLGGFEIDLSTFDFATHYLGGIFPIFSFYQRQRFYFPNSFECFLEKDECALKDFYVRFKCQYDNCKSQQELDKLKVHIVEALFNNTMYNSLTHVFGG